MKADGSIYAKGSMKADGYIYAKQTLPATGIALLTGYGDS